MPEEKPILSIETSGSLCGVCAYFNDVKYFEAAAHLKNSHAEKLFELIDFVIKSSGTSVKDFEAVAVSSGPGSFTGLRIGMSAAKGIAFGSSLPIIPVPTFEALAFQISNLLPGGSDFIIANKVNVEEIYFAKFRSGSRDEDSYHSLIDKSNNYIFAENLKIVNRNEYEALTKDCLVFGNAGKDSLEKVKSDRAVIESPSAFYVARWSKYFGNDQVTKNYDYLEPNYLKNFIVKERKND